MDSDSPIAYLYNSIPFHYTPQVLGGLGDRWASSGAKFDKYRHSSGLLRPMPM